MEIMIETEYTIKIDTYRRVDCDMTNPCCDKINELTEEDFIYDDYCRFCGKKINKTVLVRFLSMGLLRDKYPDLLERLKEDL